MQFAMISITACPCSPAFGQVDAWPLHVWINVRGGH